MFSEIHQDLWNSCDNERIKNVFCFCYLSFAILLQKSFSISVLKIFYYMYCLIVEIVKEDPKKKKRNLPTSLCTAWFNCCSSSSSSLVLESDPSMSRKDVTLLACASGESNAVLDAPFSLAVGCHGLYCALDLEYLVSMQELQFSKPGIQSSSKQGDVCRFRCKLCQSLPSCCDLFCCMSLE